MQCIAQYPHICVPGRGDNLVCRRQIMHLCPRKNPKTGVRRGLTSALQIVPNDLKGAKSLGHSLRRFENLARRTFMLWAAD